MNREELVREIAKKTDLMQKDVGAFLNAFTETVSQALISGEDVRLLGFGKFEARDRAARRGRNPQTGEVVDIPATKVPMWKPSQNLRDAVREQW